MLRALRIACCVLIPSAILAGCKEEAETAAPEIRPVRTVTVEKSESGVPVVLTGRIEALDQASFGFRISGRMIERTVNVGDRVQAGQILARLEPHNEMNALRSAKANLTAAQAKHTQVSNHFGFRIHRAAHGGPVGRVPT